MQVAILYKPPAVTLGIRVILFLKLSTEIHYSIRKHHILLAVIILIAHRTFINEVGTRVHDILTHICKILGIIVYKVTVL